MAQDHRVWLQWPAGIIPLAQITVLDAWHGDCNLVDWLRKRDENVWSRSLIDTGPSDEGLFGRTTAEHDKLITNIKSLIAGQPVPVADKSKYPGDLYSDCIPKLSEMQITHLDDDHIGNAVEVLNALLATPGSNLYKKAVGCKVISARLPSLNLADTDIEISQTKQSHSVIGGEEHNTVSYLVKFSAAYTSLYEGTDYIPAPEVTLGRPPRYGISDSQITLSAGPSQTVVKDKGSSTLSVAYTANAVKLCSEMDKPQGANLSIKVKIWDKRVSGYITPQALRNAPTKTMSTPKVTWLSAGEDADDTDGSKPPNSKKSRTGPPNPPSGGGSTNMLFTIRQAVDFGTTVRTHCKNGRVQTANVFAGSRPWNFAPVTLQAKDKKVVNIQAYLNPTKAAYRKMIRYALDVQWSGYAKAVEDQFDNDAIMNRASIVTLFQQMKPKFKMLFTGDAYDRECDLRSTLAAWNAKEDPEDPPAVPVHVLKVPHHGSRTTASSDFYTAVKAEIYLISADVYTHGMPAWETLEAIVRGFRGKTRPGRQPFLIFLSDPAAEEHAKTNAGAIKQRSNVKRLLADPHLKPTAVPAPDQALSPDAYYYEIWRLKVQFLGVGAIGSLAIGYKEGSDPLEVVVTKSDQQWKKLGPA